jgi:glutamate 5-kinase
MMDHLQLPGCIHIDAGAVRKLCEEGKSLLPVGMVMVEGEFFRGDVIAIMSPNGQEVARGLANYASADAKRLCGKASSEIEGILGFIAEPEMVHRDNLVIQA